MKLLKLIWSWIMTVLTNTNQITDNTNAKQYKVVVRSQNYLPNDSDSFIHMSLTTVGISHSSDTDTVYGSDYLLRYLFTKPTAANCYLKLNQTGKQLLRKAPNTQVYKFGTYIQVYCSNENDPANGVTTAEMFYLLFSLGIKE